MINFDNAPLFTVGRTSFLSLSRNLIPIFNDEIAKGKTMSNKRRLK